MKILFMPNVFLAFLLYQSHEEKKNKLKNSLYGFIGKQISSIGLNFYNLFMSTECVFSFSFKLFARFFCLADISFVLKHGPIYVYSGANT